MTARLQKSGADENQTPKLAALAIVWAFLFPPAGLIYAFRCLSEANRLNVAKTLALVAAGFVAFGLILHSVLFAIFTGGTFLVVRN